MKLARDLAEELRGSLSDALSGLTETIVPPNVEGDEATLPPHVREQLFVIFRDAARNAASHSGAGAA